MKARKNGKFCSVPDGYVASEEIGFAHARGYSLARAFVEEEIQEARKAGFISGFFISLSSFVVLLVIWCLL